MKTFVRSCLRLAAIALATGIFAISVWSQGLRVPPQTNTVTLFAVNRYESRRESCLKFGTTTLGCHLRYGSLYVGDDLDWFDTASAPEIRTVVRDLGYLEWSDNFAVPVLSPFPKLLPGQHRSITVDASGADGADGAPGLPGENGADADGVVRPRSAPAHEAVPPSPAKPKRDGKPKVDPVFAKALLNHMYVVHVVDEVNDFYVLLRVESVERGDSCTVSWRVVSRPETDERIGLVSR
jgi:hypothetical protein